MSSDGIVGAYPPPPSVTPNFDHPPDSIAINVELAAILCPVFAGLFVGLRFYIARAATRRVYPDDWLILVALLFALGYSILQLCQTKYGIGIHIWDVPLSSLSMFNKIGIASAITYNFSTLFIKSSILAFYLRFQTERPLQIATYAVLLVAVGYSLAGGFGFLYLCRPIARLWDYSIDGVCVDANAWYVACAALNVGTDVVILLLPIWILRPLRVRLLQKLAVMGVLMAGGFVCAVSVVRLVAIPEGFNDPDMTWRFAINIIWCIVEMYAGIICACLPCLKAFIKHVCPGFLDRFTVGRQQVTLKTIPQTAASLPGIRHVVRLGRGNQSGRDDKCSDDPTTQIASDQHTEHSGKSRTKVQEEERVSEGSEPV